jgi:hypothetical protein
VTAGPRNKPATAPPSSPRALVLRLRQQHLLIHLTRAHLESRDVKVGERVVREAMAGTLLRPLAISYPRK